MDPTDRFFLIIAVLLAVVLFGWYLHSNGLDDQALGVVQ
jgi:hypothetical protein